MQKMNPLSTIFVAFALCLGMLGGLTACQTLTSADGTTRAATFNDNAGNVLKGTDAVVKLAKTLLVAKKITPDDADSIATAADSVRKAVAVARGYEAQAPGSGVGTAKLRSAANALDELNRYLATKGTP